MKNILLFNDTENNYHFGCTATSQAIKNELKKIWKFIKAIYCD